MFTQTKARQNSASSQENFYSQIKRYMDAIEEDMNMLDSYLEGSVAEPQRIEIQRHLFGRFPDDLRSLLQHRIHDLQKRSNFKKIRRNIIKANQNVCAYYMPTYAVEAGNISNIYLFEPNVREINQVSQEQRFISRLKVMIFEQIHNFYEKCNAVKGDYLNDKAGNVAMLKILDMSLRALIFFQLPNFVSHLSNNQDSWKEKLNGSIARLLYDLKNTLNDLCKNADDLLNEHNQNDSTSNKKVEAGNVENTYLKNYTAHNKNYSPTQFGGSTDSEKSEYEMPRLTSRKSAMNLSSYYKIS